MNCAFCKRDDDGLKEFVSPIIKKLEDEIDNRNHHILNIKEIYGKEYGFISENFKKVKEIDEFILNLSFGEFKRNVKIFINKAPNLALLKDYYNKFKPRILDEQPLKNLMEMYVNEPKNERMEEEKNILKREIESLTRQIEAIKNNNKLYKINRKNEFILNKIFNITIDLYTEIEFIKILNHEYSHDIYLCPYCIVFLNNLPAIEDIIHEEENNRKLDEESQGRKQYKGHLKLPDKGRWV